ncbi:hypothetical protein HYN48_02860 [Flavobacterium magnum]|uniref:Uncharacterized protein n=1 Tax=Flavobacterium magnum TaxID=2162713 RepID=A0A2S0RDC8_9FLAO|nr:hypothetical protein [Flavobacterium magnum]AWA29111.1 hypothetical protein HYN48_02860 [Flavobacterium magnum]
MRALYAIVTFCLFLLSGGNGAHAAAQLQGKHFAEASKPTASIQKFSSGESEKNLFEDTDRDADEDFSGSGTAKDNTPARSLAHRPDLYYLHTTAPVSLIKASHGARSLTPPGIICHAPIYITFRVLRI